MENGNKIIYLETGDDIASLASKIKKSEESAVSFVVPRGGSIAQSVVNLKLLKREAEKSGKQVSLVTKDKISKNLASQVGLTVYSSADEAKKAMTQISRSVGVTTANTSGIHVNRYDKDDEEVPVEEPKENNNKLKDEVDKFLNSGEEKKPETKVILPKKTVSVPINHDQDNNQKKKRKNVGSRKKPILIIVSAFLIVALVLAYVFLPTATISVVLATEDFSKEYEITIDKNISEINAEEMVIPGEEVIAEKGLSKDFESTGEKEMGKKASGEITFYNYDYQSSDPKILSAGTVLVAQNLNFVLTEDITIPGATATIVQGSIKVTPSTVKGNVEAQNPGTEYNIDASNFVVSSYSGSDRENVYGQSSSVLSGGTSDKKKVVSADDLERAKSETRTELTGKILEEITEMADEEDLKVIASSFVEEEISFESNKQAEEESSNFTVTLKVKTTAIAFSEDFFRDIIVELIENELSEEQMIVNSEKSGMGYELLSIDKETGKMKVRGIFEGKIGREIEQAEIRAEVRNKKMGTASADIYGMDGVEGVNIIIWPNFFTKVTSIESRIFVNFDYKED